MTEGATFSLDQLPAITGLNNTTVLLVFITTFILAYFNTRRKPGVPPGPALWPVVGNLFSMIGSDTLATLSGLRRKYGDVYGLYIGTELTVFLNGYDAIHEALVKKGTLFSRRPVTNHSKLLLKHVSVVFGNGDEWKERRKFVLNSLNEICFNSKGSYIERIIHEEITCFVDYIESSGKPLDLHGLVNMSFANVMHSVVHGKRTKYDDPSFKWYIDLLDKAFKEFAKQQLLINCFPVLAHLPFDSLQMKVHEERSKALEEYFSKTISEALKSDVNFQNQSSLAERYAALAGDENNWKYLTKDNMWIMFHDLMAAGSETSATTLRWILLHLMVNPDLQDKLYEEIQRVTGPDHLPSVSDRADMPLLQATILEGLRIGCVVPLAVPHAVPRDTNFRGHTIPKDVTVLANVASVLMDPEIFQDPNQFNPERFLNSDSTRLEVPKEFIPFSLGPRSCLGETLARLELFLYLTTLIQRFTLEVPEGENPSINGVFGLTHQPKPFKISFICR